MISSGHLPCSPCVCGTFLAPGVLGEGPLGRVACRSGALSPGTQDFGTLCRPGWTCTSDPPASAPLSWCLFPVTLFGFCILKQGSLPELCSSGWPSNLWQSSCLLASLQLGSRLHSTIKLPKGSDRTQERGRGLGRVPPCAPKPCLHPSCLTCVQAGPPPLATPVVCLSFCRCYC